MFREGERVEKMRFRTVGSRNVYDRGGGLCERGRKER